MKVMKLALLGTAALAAVSISANANDLADLKAQIEALNSRIATLEAAPSVPAGYQLMTMSKAPAILAPGEELGANDLAMVNTIGILPTADVPASTNVQWSGHVKAAFVYNDATIALTETVDGDDVLTGYTFSSSSTHINATTEVNLKATTDTAVGEVGVHVRWGASAHGDENDGGSINRYYGWWKMTPELSLTAGYKGTLGGVGHGNDKCSCNYNTFVGAVGGSDDASQFELRYASGPIAAAVAVEHHKHGDSPEDEYIVSSEVTWAGDSMSAEVAGYAGTHDGVDMWQIGAGATASLDMFTISAAAAVGEGKLQFGGNSFGNFAAPVSDLEYWQASLFASAALSDSVSAEVGVGYVAHDHGPSNTEVDVWGVAGGIYWAPVDKLTIGAEASYSSLDADFDGLSLELDSFTAALVTVFKF
jgi:hypothetical protein